MSAATPVYKRPFQSKIAKVYIIVPKNQMAGRDQGISLVKCRKLEKNRKMFL
jgi:hypothetical protein